VARELEWWPDYGDTLLWAPGGIRVTMTEVGLSDAFQRRALTWLAAYDDRMLPTVDWPGDDRWIAEGARLFAAARAELAGRYDVVSEEPYWLTA